MSWGGHAADMIARIKYNESLRKSYRNRHNIIKKAFINEYTKRNIHLLKSKDIPKDELIKIKAEIKRKLIKERRISLIKTLSTTIIAFSVFLYIILKYLIPGIVSYINR